ncbi:MAG: hypothetical protein CL692_04190 [Cellvibrionales bacterium]|nr:hypothetical protein [Cellvibrionales bacterium]
MLYAPQQKKPKAKPPCAICHVISRIVFLSAGLAFFAFFAYSPELRKDVGLTDLLQYLSLENMLFLMFVAIVIKLALAGAQQLFKK